MSNDLAPPIIISPVDPECRLTKEECEEIEKRIRDADDGDVVCLPVPVEIHVFVDGAWIPADQLAKFQAAPEQPANKKREPAESTYDPNE